jgi:hypothetical protein
MKYFETFQGLLDEQYYSIGCTGAQALVGMLDDFNEGRLVEFLAEQEVTETEFLMTVNRLAVKWASEDVLNVIAGFNPTPENGIRRRVKKKVK